MKKLALSLMLLGGMGVLCAQAQKKSTTSKVVTTAATKVALKSEADTLSYAYGVGLVEQGLEQYLKQTGVVTDTTEAVNNKNIDLFLKGIKEALAAKSGQDAYYKGVGLGAQMSQMTAGFGQMVGDEAQKINMPAFISGFETALKKGTLLVDNSNELIQKKYMESQSKAQEKKDADSKIQYADNIAAGEKFLAENKTIGDVVTLPSGLQYKVLVEGTGAKPKASDKVKVHYHGTLIDGTVFDSSIDRGEPITFGVTDVIKGWTEALQLMPVGSKWMVYIPYDLAYGSRDAGTIKPYSTLVFEIELLDIE